MADGHRGRYLFSNPPSANGFRSARVRLTDRFARGMIPRGNAPAPRSPHSATLPRTKKGTVIFRWMLEAEKPKKPLVE